MYRGDVRVQEIQKHFLFLFQKAKLASATYVARTAELDAFCFHNNVS